MAEFDRPGEAECGQANPQGGASAAGEPAAEKHNQRPEGVAAILGQERWEGDEPGPPEQASGYDEGDQEGVEGAIALDGSGGTQEER